MKHRILKTLVIFMIIACAIASVVFYAIYISPENLRITHRNIESTKIPESMDDINIAYLSDIHYGEFMDEKRFEKMVDKINQAAPDVILFGGDLFSDPLGIAQDQATVDVVSKLMNSLNAPLGKFYVLGECDVVSEDAKTFVSQLLYNAGFENLTNKSIQLHNGSTDSIRIIGIDSLLNGSPDIPTAYNNISEESFNIAFTHVPDIIADIPENSTDLAFAGHSHGGQISLPIIGPLSSSEGTDKFESGIYETGKLIIAISNGIGTSGVDMRLFSPPEVLIYRLQHKKSA